jgi:hypothetical protein
VNRARFPNLVADLTNRKRFTGRFNTVDKNRPNFYRRKPDMNRFRLYFILIIVPAAALPAQGGLFSKKPRPASPPASNTETRVPDLLFAVKMDPDEGKRTAAIAELRQYDSGTFPDIIPILVDVMQNDTKPAVRREAAHALGRLRPLSQPAGLALQQAAAKDPSLRVRIQAWSSFKLYQFSGFSSRPKEPATAKAPARPGSGEPAPADAPNGTIVDPKSQPAGVRVIDSSSPASRKGPFQRPWSTSIPDPPRRLTPPIVEEDGPAVEPQKNET